LNDGKGHFTKSLKALPENNGNKSCVRVCDIDGDGDMDLYVVSGGAEFAEGDKLYQDRLYKNDGKGRFSKAINALPAETNNGSCVIALDYDGDGDMDLFVGGGVMPGRFPLHDKSMLLQNNNGVFKDVINEVAPGINDAGIINGAVWADIDGDKVNELIITGEWMAPTIFKMKNGVFEKINAGLDAYTGWWNCIKAVDVDGDGDLDLIVGNRGTNSRVTADLKHPCTMYAKDFDGNGSYDAVMGYYIGDKCYPMFSRDQLIDQMPMFRKKYVRYKYYAGKTMDDIFTADQKKGMNIFTSGTFESGIFINDGNGTFHFQPFPEKAQLSTINDLIAEDIDGDGIKDILVAGNSNDADVATGNYDATAALFLKGTGKGNFIAVPKIEGPSMRGEIRRIIYLKENKCFIFLKNNDAAQLFSGP